jgi:replicative DNA helicase
VLKRSGSKETGQRLKLEQKPGGLHKLERELLKLLLDDSSLISRVKTRLNQEDFYFPEDGKLYELILSYFQKGKNFSPAALIDRTEDQKLKTLITEIATLDLGKAEPELMLEDYLKKLELTRKSVQVKNLKEEIRTALDKGEEEKAEALTVKLQDLIRE